jgi:AcrR family transcriptional regulator
MPVETTGARGSALKTRSRSGGASPRVHIAELQRARLLSAAVVAVDEFGWSRVTVAHITGRARVSRRTFYDLFENREDCLRAVLEDIVERIAGEIADAPLAGCDWRERVRGGLLVILSFFDREPVLARLCVVQALRGGPRVLEWREDILARLAAIVDEGRGESGTRSRECTVLTAEGLVGATFAVVHARLLANRRREPLRSLLGELMSLIVLPYQGPAVARSERRRSVPRVKRAARESAQNAVIEHDPLQDVPMRLTYRTARVLDGVAMSPGASNRTIGEAADIYDQGQISKLLARLERLGLLANTGQGQTRGEPNRWSLTPKGTQVQHSIHAHTHNHDRTPA